MPLDKILQALAAEAEMKSGEIEQATAAEIERLRAEAAPQAAAARQSHLPAMQAPLQAERARILNQAKQEALRTVMGTREALLGEAFTVAAERLAGMHARPEYSRLLEQLACEAVAALGHDGELCLRVEARDVPLMQRVVRACELRATVEPGDTDDGSPWRCSGGVIATGDGGRISLANTLSARLQRVASLYRSELAGMLFGES